MTNIFIIVALLVIFFLAIQKFVIRHDDSKSYAYQRKGAVLTPAESTFYQALKAAVGDHGVVLTKVSMAQVVAPAKGLKKKQWFIANNRVARSQFNYLVCDARTLEPRVVVELDDGKSLSKPKIEREKLLMQVCKTAGIPLIGANIRYSYQVSKLRRLLAAHIDLIETDKEVRFCKRCGSPMNIKVASQGEFKGRRFFTCSRQPHCTYTENYNVVFELDDNDDQLSESLH